MRRHVTKKAKRAVIGAALTTGILITSYGAIVHFQPADAPPPTPIEEVTPGAAVVSREAIIRMLSDEGQIVGLSGDIDKRAQVVDDKWYGDRTYDIAILGEFKLGIDTADIEISTSGNTVTVTFPQPALLSATANFDEAIIYEKATGVRKDFTTEEQQAIFKQTREEAIEEIKANEYFEERAEESIGKILRGLISQVPGVQEIDINVSE